MAGLVLGLLGPLLSLIGMVWGYYFVSKPRPKVRYEEGPRLEDVFMKETEGTIK